MTKARDLASAAPAPAGVTSTELGYVDGVTSALQTQLNAKQGVVSGVDSTEIGYLDGVTSAIQTQLDAKIAKTLTTTTGDIIYASSANTPARLGIGSTDQVLKVTGGVPVWATPATGTTFKGASVWMSADQVIASGVDTNINFDSEYYDTDGFHSTTVNTDRFTIPTGLGGYYLVVSNIWYAARTTSFRQSMIRKNDSSANDTYWSSFVAPTSGQQTVTSISAIIKLNAGDFVTSRARQDSGSDLNVVGSANFFTKFAISYLGA